MVYHLSFSRDFTALVALLLSVVVVASFLCVDAVSTTSTSGSFVQDVIARGVRLDEPEINNELLSHAILLEDYKAKLQTNGQQIIQPLVSLQQQNHGFDNRSRKVQENQDGGDDFFLSDDAMYSFSGYSIKYAQCQPVQYFSEDAIAAGEHSPMVIEDIVILRLCPQKSCSSSAIYGCHYNYAEYAISLSTYLRIMLTYSAKRLEATCEWCEACQKVADGGGNNNGNRRHRRRKLEERVDEEENVDEMDGNGAQEQDNEEADEEDLEEEQDNKAQQAGDDEYNSNLSSYVANCPYYSTYCSNYQYDCNPESNDDTYISFKDYEKVIESGYLNCAEAKYNNYVYYVRPRCDGSDGTMKMAVFYDQFCVQYAGSDVSVKNMGLGFHEDIFETFYSSQCIECGVDDESSPPSFELNGALCNKIHDSSAKCTSDMSYNLFDGYQSSSSECSYIESIRYGTYDETGKLSAYSITSGVSWTTEVSVDQKIMLGIAVAICIVLIFYACYIHHSMTNLLIKSLSHRELLPPSRHRSKSSRRTGGTTSSSSRFHNRASNNNNGDDDWEKPTIV